MKRTTSDLLDDYRHADFTKRLNLYLQYPELRREFIETDRNEHSSREPKRLHKSKWSSQFFTRTFGMKWLCGCPFGPAESKQ